MPIIPLGVILGIQDLLPTKETVLCSRLAQLAVCVCAGLLKNYVALLFLLLNHVLWVNKK